MSSPALQRAPRLSIRESLRCARLKLWDEQKRRLVGFPRRRQTALGLIGARFFRNLAPRRSRCSGTRDPEVGSYLKRGRPLWIPSALASR